MHAIDHKGQFLWNSHLVHHSGEEFNLACALRQSISVFVRLFVILLLPAALLVSIRRWWPSSDRCIYLHNSGILHAISIPWDSWRISLPTPSHHRVHHTINPNTSTKIMARFLFFWDKLFGTFQRGLPHVKPVYGITRPVRTWNPIKINFQHLWLLISDTWHTTKLAG